MSKATRMHISPGVLVTALGVVAVLALMAAVVWLPGPAQAQDDGPSGPPNPFAGTPTPTMDPATPTPTTPPGVAAGDMIKSDSKTASGSPEFKLTIVELPMDMSVGSSIVLYLEDDFAEPDSIPMSSVYLVAEGMASNYRMAPHASDETHDIIARQTGNGARVYVTGPVKLKTGAYFDEDKKDIAVRVLVPDMCTNATDECEGPNGLRMGQMVTLVIESDSGIKNPSEAGTHSVSFDLLEPTDAIPSAGSVRGRNDARRDADPSTELTVKTLAKISLSDVDNKRGYEMTVTGSGFNDGTTAAVYVLAHARYQTAKWWETLDCAGMKAAMGKADSDTDEFCSNYDLDDANMSYELATRCGPRRLRELDADDRKMYSAMVFTQHLCRIIVDGDDDANIQGGHQGRRRAGRQRRQGRGNLRGHGAHLPARQRQLHLYG